ncbi:MAG: hybrid sensor histidine kinase/response regulator, partial [Planctomycetota bacterium]
VKSGWEVLSRNLDRIFDLTMNMLAYSKQRKPEIEMMNLDEMLREIIELFQAQCDRQGVALITELDVELPPVPADASELHQVVMNLLNNALDAVEPGTGVVTLRTEYDPQQPEARIAISDNGTGMDRDSLKQIFTPFYSTKGQRGTGLGLAVARKIIDEHGGRIDVASEPGSGATFTIHLPGCDEAQEVVVDQAGTRIPAGQPGILVIDDDDMVRTIAVRMLQHAGYRVVAAADGRAGVELYRRHRSDLHLVLLDMLMPGIGGPETLRELPEVDPGVRVLICTGFGGEDALAGMRRTGIAGILHKPYRARELRTRVAAILQDDQQSC